MGGHRRGDARPGRHPLGRERARVLHLVALLVGGEAQDEQPPARRERQVDRGRERPEPEVRRHGQRVPRQRRAVAEERLRVRVHGRADVAPLGVHDDERPGRLRRRDHVLEGRDPARAVPLEERRLRLDRGHAPPDRLDDPETELADARGVVGQAPCLEEAGVRVDPDAQGPVVVHGRGEPRPERCRHAVAPARRAVRSARCSCRLPTANGPASCASMPCTAAESCWTVVTIGLSAAVVAARIS